MRHAVGDAGIPGIGIDRSAGECLEGGGADEAGGGLGHDHLHRGAAPLQFTGQFAGLEGGHAAGHAEQEVPPAQFAGVGRSGQRVCGDQRGRGNR